ncbi:uncharacterized protein LOC128513191 [Clarias gariepinus]|uniref:uncharacterized protein LOC128513191 n=1 Tax=Clarias gariepinus TaxID=13013 RepID=UPI00234DD6B3|nr:uncharacterized protein LOC128513191 [Clarias gariepinus]XP_053342861.1 uncharacterized protein LOC128513191 [Clarias gariepinus]
MQNTTWTPPITEEYLSCPHQTLCTLHYYPVSQPFLSSANLQSNQALQLGSHEYQRQFVYMSPASAQHPPPNMLQHVSWQARPLGMFMVNSTHETQFLNPSIHRNYNDLHSMQNVGCTCPNNVPSNTNCVYKNSCCMYGSPFNRQFQGQQTTYQPRTHSQQAGLFVQTRLKPPTTNMYQEQMSIIEQHNKTPSSVAQMNNMPTNSLLPTEFRTFSTQVRQSQVKNALDLLSPSRKDGASSQTPFLKYRARLKSATQNRSGQRLKKVPSSLPQDKIQSQTTTISGNLSVTNLATFNATQSSRQSQVLKSNNMSGLTMNPQDSTSISTSISHISFSKAGRGQDYQNPDKETDNLRESETGTGSNLAQLQNSHQNEITNCEKQNRKAQSFIDATDSQTRTVQQVNEVVNERLLPKNAETCTSKNDPMPGSQHCENIPESVTVSSNQCQDSVCVLDTTSEQPEDQEVKSSPEDSTFNLSTVPVVDYTLKELEDLVNSLESSQAERDKSSITNLTRCILDLYYDGDQKNLWELHDLKVELQESLKNTPELFVKEMHAVVFQYVAFKHLKMLKHCSQILGNETTLPSEDFRSSWLNVDGQPANIEKVLAEPLSDYNLTWCKEVQQSVSESGVDDVDSPVQTKDIMHSNSEHSAAIFAVTDCNKDVLTHEKSHVSTTYKELCRMPSELRKRSSQELNDEVEMVKENERVFTEPTLSRSSDECETSYSNVCEKTDTSDDEDSSSDLPKIILLSSEDARKIFNECSELESEVKPLSDLKFICPHVTDLTFHSDLFCPSCLYEAKVLDLNEAESLPEPNMDYQRTSCSPQSEITTMDPCAPVCLDSYSIVSSVVSRLDSDGTDMTRDPNQGDQPQISSSPHAQELHHGIVGSKETSITESSVAEDFRESTSSSETNSIDLKVLSSRNDRECRNESKESTPFTLKKRILDQHYSNSKSGTPSQTPNANKIPEGNNVKPHKQKRPVIKEKRQGEPSKKIILKLYGSNRSDSSSHDEKKSPSTRIYLNVSPSNEKSYMDEPSAKQKVYRQWSNTFVHPQKKSFSNKKSQKLTEELLKSKIQTLKSNLKDRSRAN